MFTGLRHTELFVDLLLERLDCRGVIESLFWFWNHEIRIFYDTVHQQGDLHEKVGVTDPDTASA